MSTNNKIDSVTLDHTATELHQAFLLRPPKPHKESGHRRAFVVGPEVRLRILCMLTRAPQTVSAICNYLSMSQPSVSSHLVLMREAGVVESRVQGKSREYRLTYRGGLVLDKALRFAALLGGCSDDELQQLSSILPST